MIYLLAEAEARTWSVNVPASSPGRGPTHYEVLGLTAEATADQVKSAYRAAARRAHPDLGGSADIFHAVALAYETLSDPTRRTAYDRTLGARTTGRTTGHTASSPSASRAHASSSNAFRTNAPRATPEPELYRQSPLFQPPYTAHPLPGEEPPLPMAMASRQAHGEPRRPGLWGRLGGDSSYFEGELLTMRVLSRGLLPSFPAARLVSGLTFPSTSAPGRSSSGRMQAGHALLAGYRLALIDSLRVAPGNYHWDGRVLRRDGKPMGPVRLVSAVSAMQDLFPECRVNGWLTLHSTQDNPFEPVVDSPPSLNRGGLALVQAVNAGSLVRDLKRFLAEGPQPNVVQLPVLSRLLTYSGAPPPA